jgi:beta-glucosidase-like glycosyl hydrolase
MLDARELVPFRAAFAAGASSMMTAHIRYPALDDENIATLSPRILGALLRGELGFVGLAITDSLDMSGLTQVETPDAATEWIVGVTMRDYLGYGRPTTRIVGNSSSRPACSRH